MNDNEFLELDRKQKINQILDKYGEENFYISFSGGRDSTILSAFIDIARPGNQIPRVFADTGIELNEIRKFVYEKQKTDSRIQIIKPSVPIVQSLERDGYPFKSKEHSHTVAEYQKNEFKSPWVRRYARQVVDGKEKLYNPCPKKLMYQFTDECQLKISDMCCVNMKEEPLNRWQKENGVKYGITGIMRAERGRRTRAQCLSMIGNRLKNFQPFVPVGEDFLDYLQDKYHIEICKLYGPPYNFRRTGCKGCPYNIHIQDELDTLQKYFPRERESNAKGFGGQFTKNIVVLVTGE